MHSRRITSVVPTGGAWTQDHSACPGLGLRDSVRSHGEAASQHTGGPSAHMQLHVLHMEAGKCTGSAEAALGVCFVPDMHPVLLEQVKSPCMCKAVAGMLYLQLC